MNAYRDWVGAWEALIEAGAALRPEASTGANGAGRKVLIFAPHPDDEVIIGGLALRLQRELGFAVTNVAVTLGSDPARRPGRLREMESACRFLGFRTLLPAESGLSGINPAARASDPAAWEAKTALLAALLHQEAPDLVFLPHAADWNVTHVGTHLLVMDALGRLPELRCLIAETEFWGAMAAPNLMVESGAADVASLVAALALHTGEVARNPYHLRLPAWMIDNVRRGAELVGGQGAGAPAATFATLYRLGRWEEGSWRAVLPAGRMLAAGDDLAEVFAPWK